jgi:hypothetical protein
MRERKTWFDTSFFTANGRERKLGLRAWVAEGQECPSSLGLRHVPREAEGIGSVDTLVHCGGYVK